MHEVYAALAIVTLKQEIGQKDRLSEDEFYAHYSEEPWSLLRRLARAMRERLQRRRETKVACKIDQGKACRLAET
jgi:hypothetical protein